MKTLVIIPSRLSASRLPGKPLLKINGLSMISHVFKKAEEANIGEVIVAAEDQEIVDDVKKNGGNAILTSNQHKTGTDRIYEAFQKLDIPNIDLIMNLQGDEPLMNVEDIRILKKGIYKSTISNGDRFIVFDDIEDLGSPDAIFPNNWVTFHDDGVVVLYPMMSSKRRNERRMDIIEKLSFMGFALTKTIDLTHLENNGHYLEGTGSMILDRLSKKAYACISSRTTKEALDTFSDMMSYEIIEFSSSTKIPIYHT